MKTILLPILCLFALSASAQMQPPPLTKAELAAKDIAEGKEMPEPFKGATTILIHTTDSAGVALKKFARILLVNGLEPDKIDAEIGYLTTKDKPVGGMSPAIYQYKVVSTAGRSGTTLAISGNYITRLTLTQTMSIPMFWVKGNLLKSKQCFAMIEAAALAYPSGQIGYIGKPERPVIRQY